MKRINSVRPTEAMLFDVRAKSMQGRVYNLAAGDPDLPPCKALRDAYRGTCPEKVHSYCSSAGLPSLREKLWSNPGEVIIANGAKQLIYMSLAAVTKPGDKVIIIGPCWTSYMRICDLLGLEYTLLTGKAENRFIPDINQVCASITPETSAVLINSPNNPTGVVYPDSYIDRVLETVRENDCWLIADEIYRYICSVPFRSLRGEDSVIVIDGFSKSLSITGWRLGYAIACEEIIKAMTGIQSQMSGPPSTLIQEIVCSGWDKLSFYSFEDYRGRIDALCSIPKFAAARPEGGFYFYVPIDERWESSARLCEYMLTECRVAITPGDDYGVERTVRVSIASENAESLMEIRELLREI